MSLIPENTEPQLDKRYAYLSLFLAICLAGTTYWLLLHLGEPIAGALAVTAFAAVLWISEALPLAVTALLIPVGMAVIGVFEESNAFTSFANPVVFLVLGGYAIGSAVSANGLDHWIAQSVLKHAGTSSLNVAAALMVTSALLSMFMSNTATMALLLPVALGMIKNQEKDTNLSRLLPLSIAYGASIGGVATLVGSPPNAIAAGMLDISFLQWLTYGLPISLVMLACAIPILWFTFRPMQSAINIAFDDNTKLSPGGKRTLTLTGIILTLWLVGPLIGQGLSLPRALFSTSAVACFGIAMLILARCISWSKLQGDAHWGVLLLLGGGLTLGRGLTESGAADWLGQLLLANVVELPPLGLMIVIVSIAVFATELVSNTAITAKLAPILLGIALQLGLEAESLVVAVAIASSMAFMLPVATPPNAMVHASGLVSQRDMMRAGISLNLTAIAVIALFFYWLY